MRRHQRAGRRLQLESLEQRRCLSASVGWDGVGLDSAELTYYIDEVPDEMDLSEAEVRAALETALSAWASIADIRFVETSTAGEDDSIDFTFGTIDGTGNTLAYAYYPSDVNSEPIAGDIIFDVDETWEIGNDLGTEAYDLVYVAVHEVGHALGLDHSLVSGSVMADDSSADRSFSGLTVVDESAILALYAPATTSEGTSVTLDKTVVSDGDLITLTGKVGTPSDTETLNVMVYWGDGSAVETLIYLPGTTSFSVSHLYSTDSAGGTDSDYQVYYSMMEDDSYSDLSYLVVSVVRYDVGLTDLGTVDYLAMESMSLDNDVSYYQFDVAHSGIATLETLAASAGDDVSIELYTSSPVVSTSLVPVAVSTASDGGQRLDYEVTAGQTYYVKVEGTSADFDLRITNLVSQDDTAVTVYGTDNDDEFEFSAGEDRQFTINGTLYEFGDAEISTIEFDGGDGYDLVILHDSAGDDTLEAWATEAVLRNEAGDGVANFTVNVSGFEELHAYARYGGNDKATLYDSEGDDKFKAEPEESYAKMYGGAMYNRVKFFDVVEAYSSGGTDLARVFDTAGDDTFVGQKDASSLSGEDYEVNMFGFARVLAYASEGTDSVSFVDSEMKDELHAKPAKAELFDAATNGEVYRITARSFDSLYAVASNTEGSSEDGGADIAKIWPTASDDLFEATEDWFQFYRDDELLYEVVAFETIKVRETTDEGDSASITEPLEYTLLLADGWE